VVAEYHAEDSAYNPDGERWSLFCAISRYNYDTLLSWRICDPNVKIERITGGIHLIRRPVGRRPCKCEGSATICKRSGVVPARPQEA
jgi:hypothetical protein